MDDELSWADGNLQLIQFCPGICCCLLPFGKLHPGVFSSLPPKSPLHPQGHLWVGFWVTCARGVRAAKTRFSCHLYCSAHVSLWNAWMVQSSLSSNSLFVSFLCVKEMNKYISHFTLVQPSCSRGILILMVCRCVVSKQQECSPPSVGFSNET